MFKCHRLLIVIALLAALCVSVGAQSYSIRVTYNTNIRAEPSLNGRRLETVPAGTVLEVIEQFNRWLRVNRGGGAWMAGWVSHQRVEAAQPVTDNCCGIDRQCQREDEWVAGYWAYQRGQCGAPAPTGQTPAAGSQPAPAVTDNCCGIDRQCHSDQQWIDGYWAYQRGQCGAPGQISANVGLHCNHQHELVDGYWRFLGGSCTTSADASHAHIRITEKTAGFADLVNRGFELLKAKAPEWYTFSILWTNAVREVHSWAEVGAFPGGLSSWHHEPHIRPIIPEDDITMAEFLVHEACHHAQRGEGRLQTNGLYVEYECAQKQLVAAYLVGPVQHHIDGLEYFIANPQDQNVWWW